jgi:hypothetical protein
VRGASGAGVGSEEGMTGVLSRKIGGEKGRRGSGFSIWLLVAISCLCSCIGYVWLWSLRYWKTGVCMDLLVI